MPWWSAGRTQRCTQGKVFVWKMIPQALKTRSLPPPSLQNATKWFLRAAEPAAPRSRVSLLLLI